MELISHDITRWSSVFQDLYFGSIASGAVVSPVRCLSFPLPQMYMKTDWDHWRKLWPWSLWFVTRWEVLGTEGTEGWDSDLDVTSEEEVCEAMPYLVMLRKRPWRRKIRAQRSALIPWRNFEYSSWIEQKDLIPNIDLTGWLAYQTTKKGNRTPVN